MFKEYIFIYALLLADYYSSVTVPSLPESWPTGAQAPAPGSSSTARRAGVAARWRNRKYTVYCQYGRGTLTVGLPARQSVYNMTVQNPESKTNVYSIAKVAVEASRASQDFQALRNFVSCFCSHHHARDPSRVPCTQVACAHTYDPWEAHRKTHMHSTGACSSLRRGRARARRMHMIKLITRTCSSSTHARAHWQG